MSPRARSNSILALVAIAALCLGLWLGGHPSGLPSFLRDAFVNTEGSVHAQLVRDIEDDFYKDVPKGQLENASLKGLVNSLKDPYSTYFTPSETRMFTQQLSGKFEGVGMSIDPTKSTGKQGLYVSRVFDGSPASQAGIVTGARIVAVNGKSIVGENSDLATAKIRGPAGTQVTLTFVPKPGAAQKSVKLERKRLDIPLVDGRMETRSGKKLGYVELSQFDAGAHTQLRQRIDKELSQGAKGILLDLRQNGGGELEEGQLVASIFLPKGKLIVSTRGRTQPEQKLYAKGDPIPASIPVVVLVDGGTASASEIVTGALRDWSRATIAGTKTFGKGVFQETLPLSNDGLLKLTVGSYYLPKGENLQGNGIVPAVKASDNPKTKGTDEGLDSALATLAAKVR